MRTESRRPDIQYPCEWTYTVIGNDPEHMRRAITLFIPEATCEIGLSRVSRTGKFVSLNVRLVVFSEEERDRFYRALAGHEHIKMVL